MSKLKEKFKQWLDTDPRVQIRDVQLEVIADEYAIGFAEWFIDSEGKPKGEWSIKELLELYKTEKGL